VKMEKGRRRRREGGGEGEEGEISRIVERWRDIGQGWEDQEYDRLVHFSRVIEIIF